MRVFLVHVRDPQFYALPAKTRAKNGNIRVMGFPPIGIMSLSAVLKEAGHECVMFDQANPDTPNAVILEQIHHQQPSLVGLSFLSTTSYPYAKILARQIRAANSKVKLAFGGVFASLNAPLVKLQCPEVDFICRGDGEQLILDLLANLEEPEGVCGLTWMSDGRVVQNPGRPIERHLDQWPFPDRESLKLDFVESMPLDVPAVLSMDRFTTMQTSRGCPWPCVFCDIPIFNEGKWRARSAQHVVDELKYLESLGYGSVYFVDDHFLLQPKRIEAICQGVTNQGLHIQWGIEGRVDSVAQHLFPAMAKAHCRTVMFGIESGSQAILDRLKKEQTLQEVETAVTNAKNAGIEIVHGFFTVGNPDETVEDMKATFDFAAKLPLDTFGFNRLCVYRGTPLWQEYIKRGLVSEASDWYKYFKCSEIDPTCLPGETINHVRQEGLKRLFIYKLTRYPLQTFRLLRRFLRFMPVRDVVYLIMKPFLGQKKGATKAEILSRAVEHADMKDAAAQLTHLTDEMLHNVLEASRVERQRIQLEAESSRELPMVPAR
ncbi:B12-binding domain-containing radical SAM protein [Nitrospira sp. KM1]|uniref:B12-binding domain-containing radical SAM protein n=1 Tax=Nitrospira sp. KM1 TaxID=1936990 RepID=UPI0013A73075|nr:radical SAM protein [Nitrospira sp. KM1]BCA55900.1 B12-binding domain-containing radical SAM protein [Nitrospira sp. KM1]